VVWFPPKARRTRFNATVALATTAKPIFRAAVKLNCSCGGLPKTD
jgi:hypothetical protein